MLCSLHCVVLLICLYTLGGKKRNFCDLIITLAMVLDKEIVLVRALLSCGFSFFMTAIIYLWLLVMGYVGFATYGFVQ